MKNAIPLLRFPSELPISAHREAIAEAIARHQVLIVCGDTGSGKTTQLPKIAMAAGRGQHGLIGITQPRRLAARAMATRVAEELGGQVGGFVGLQHRFERRISPETRIKFMTDGILLAETRHDHLLRAYDTLIIDEAHERSLNIDFILGILRTLLPRRPDLRVIISSATLDVDRFAAFFATRDTPAPVFTIEGRLYPVTTRYHPAQDADEPDLPRMIVNALHELETDAPGDVLVFLPGERDIREAAEVLDGRRLADTAVIPLLASLPAGEQQRAFKTIPGVRRVILATNVAETSITLPGIRAVIDSGLARVPRWNSRTRVQRLQIEAISQASANQRAGRCGRVGPGVCIRLYSSEDFAERTPYTDPEITRSSLAGVILTMLDLRLGDITTFPFIDPPPPSSIRAGLRELIELGAVTHEEVPASSLQGVASESHTLLTHLGTRLTRLPLEPRLARILFAAEDEKALKSALIVVASLECDDPRQRPVDKQAEADAAHAQFLTPSSDFAARILIWRWYEEQGGFSSNTTARRLCRKHFLSFPRMRDWRDLHGQIERLTRTLGLDPSSDSGGEGGLHRALLTGLLGHIGKFDPEAHDYCGAHGLRFALFPGSGLAKAARAASKRKRHDADAPPTPARPPLTAMPLSRAWVIAGELVETARLFARTAACIDPNWIEPIAGHLCKSSFHSPWWDAAMGFARVRERVTLHGLVLVESRTRDFSRINPAEARELFIRHGIIGGGFPKPPPVIRETVDRLTALRSVQAKSRRPQPLVDEEALYAFFDARIPLDMCSADALRRWLRQEPARADALRLDETILPRPEADTTDFPDALTLDGKVIPLIYRHAPGEPDDGITCTVSTDLLPLLRAWRADWLVPGALPDKVRWMLTALPAKTRRLLRPLDDTITRCLSRMPLGREPLTQALSRALYEVASVRVPAETWREHDLPDWLRIRFVVTDASGKPLDSDRSFDRLWHTFMSAATSSEANSDTATSTLRWHQDDITAWTFGDLPDEINMGRDGWPIIHYPALVDASPTACSLRLYPDPATALAAHHAGLVRLFALALGRDYTRLSHPPSLGKGLRGITALLETTPEALGEEIATAAIKAVFLDEKPIIRTAAVWHERLATAHQTLAQTHARISTSCLAILHEAAAIEQAITKREEPLRQTRQPVRPNVPAPIVAKPRTSDRGAELATFAELLTHYNRKPEPAALAASLRRATSTTPNVTLPAAAANDLQDQLAWLVYPGFIRMTPWARLQHYPRYLEGIRMRLERLQTNAAGDLKRLAEIAPHWKRYTDFVSADEKPLHNRAALDDYRWLVEEFRISRFAQELRTVVPVSAKRLDAQWSAVTS